MIAFAVSASTGARGVEGGLSTILSVIVEEEDTEDLRSRWGTGGTASAFLEDERFSVRLLNLRLSFLRSVGRSVAGDWDWDVADMVPEEMK